MSNQTLWILAGGNGSGKSTFHKLLLENTGIPFLNADVIAKGLGSDELEKANYRSAIAARELFMEFIENRISFCYETVFSHESKIDFVRQAKLRGYTVNLVYIYLEPGLHGVRVRQRVRKGGHDVDPRKIEARVERLKRHVATTASLVHTLIALDNSSADDPFKVVAIKVGKAVEARVDPLPPWAQELLFSAESLER